MPMNRHPKEYRMPAEWALHRGIIMEWPVSDVVWGEGIHMARGAFARVARTVSRFEPLHMITNPGLADEARSLCGDTVEIIQLSHDDCWARDNGPTFVKDQKGRLVAVNWRFNAWGGIYPNFALDNTLPPRLCDLWEIPCLDVPMVLEGGSIHTNGEGLILTTEECLLNPNRNAGMSHSQIEETLCYVLGGQRVLWLPLGLYGDETSGHVDNLCCFLDPGTVLLHWTNDMAHPNYDRVRKAEKILRENGLGVEKIIQPPEFLHNGEPLPMSYVNFVFVNGGLILPGFGGAAEKTDAAAKDQLQSLFPDREIVQLPTLEIIKGGGNIHCITQQIPE